MTSTRVTIADVRKTAAELQPLLIRAHVIPDGAELILNEGSPTCGQAWRLFYREPPLGGEMTIRIDPLDHGWPNMGYLGWTKREALATLREVRYNALARLGEAGATSNA